VTTYWIQKKMEHLITGSIPSIIQQYESKGTTAEAHEFK